MTAPRTATASRTATAPARQHRLRTWWERPAVQLRGPYVLLGLLATLYVIVNVAKHDGVASVYDEVTYLDWILSLPGNLIAQTGEPFSEAGRELFACQGVMYFGTAGPACGGDYSNLLDFPQQGRTTADAYTPVFFWITWAFAKVVSLFGPDLVFGARLAMLLWLVPTALILFAVMRLARVRDGVGVAVVALFIVTPFSWWSFTYLSTDATVPLIGALSLLVLFRFLRGEGSLWWLVPIAAAGQLLKVTTFLAPLLVGLVLALIALARVVERRTGTAFAADDTTRTFSFKQWFLPLIAAGAALGAVQVGWMLVRKVTAIAPAPDQALTMSRGDAGEFLFQIGNFLLFGAVAHPTQALGAGGWTVAVVYGLLISFLVIGGVLAMVLRRPASRLEFGLGWGTAIAAVTFGPLLLGVLYLMGTPFPLPARYGAALLPAFFLMIAMAARWAGARWLLIAAAIAAVGYTFLRTPVFA